MSRATINRGDALQVGFWLIFDSDGGVRLTRTEPGVSRKERAMSCECVVPKALFRTPTLRASFTIEHSEPSVAPINLTAAGEALKGVLGVDVEMRIIEPEE